MSKVLLVEDDDVVRELVRRILESEGYQIIEQMDGSGTLEAITREKPKLLLTDIVMPNQEGLETIRMVRAEFPDLPIIAISSHGLYLEMAESIGANGSIEKPIEAWELLNLVDEVMA